MRKYRSIDERVLQRLIDNAAPGETYISRTRARSGLLSVSASEFDAILTRHSVVPTIDPVNRGQRYDLAEIAVALNKLRMQFDRATPASIFGAICDATQVPTSES